MALIKLDDNYSVECETYNFILKYKNVRFDEVKNQNVTSTNEWYFPKLSIALDKYMNECFKSMVDVSELLVELKRIELLICNLK